MLTSVSSILPMATIRRRKLLPVTGRVLVRIGQKVNLTEVIAEANLPMEHLILNISKALGLSAERVDELFHFKQGDKVDKGDILAGPVGLTRRVVRSPVAGRVIFAGDGQFMLEVECAPYELRAGMPGIVVSLIPDRGAELETTGGLVQGVWGNEKIDVGIMRVVVVDRANALKNEDLDIKSRGAIIVAGHCNEVEILRAAVDLHVRGLILGSMASSLESEAYEMPFPIILLDGFGDQPMNSAAYDLLTANNQQEVVVNAEGFDRWDFKRPEIIIPVQTQEQPPEPVETSEFSPNQKVKIVQGPSRGTIGTLINLRSKLEVFPSGLRASAATVTLESGETVKVPLVNLEILG